MQPTLGHAYVPSTSVSRGRVQYWKAFIFFLMLFCTTTRKIVLCSRTLHRRIGCTEISLQCHKLGVTGALTEAYFKNEEHWIQRLCQGCFAFFLRRLSLALFVISRGQVTLWWVCRSSSHCLPRCLVVSCIDLMPGNLNSSLYWFFDRVLTWFTVREIARISYDNDRLQMGSITREHCPIIIGHLGSSPA